MTFYRSGTPENRKRVLAGLLLMLPAMFAIATPSFAQTRQDNTGTKKAYSAVTKKSQGTGSARPAATTASASQASGNAQAQQAQSPLTPLWGVLNENYTNFSMGPLHKTQNILVVEPIIPLKLTPDWNLITRWNTPITYMPQLAAPLFVPPMGSSPGINFPGIGPEFGLSNMNPQFFFTPANPGSFSWGVGPALWLPTATNKTLGIDKWGGGPAAVVVDIEGPLLVGALVQNIWAGTHGTSTLLQRVNELTIRPLAFYTLPEGWYLASTPIISADWTVDEHNRWTVPLGGGFGRVFPVGNIVMDLQVQAFYNGVTAPAAGITNVGTWTGYFLLHFLFPPTTAPVPSLF